MDVQLPTFIGLVGNPKAGKTTAAEMLVKTFGFEIIDTGGPLRKMGMDYFGLTRDQVYTQEGKASFVEINGTIWQVRKILGKLGQNLEDQFGEEIIPLMSHMALGSTIGRSFIDPSCRKVQSHYWKRQGGTIIGIRNPLAPPSIYDFDQFDATAVDHWIDNDALACGLPEDLARQDLQDKIEQLVIRISLDNMVAGSLSDTITAAA